MKDLSILRLADLYGTALTEKQRAMVSDYYERDFSLSEIAENHGVSRQAVHAALTLAAESLKGYEEKFGFCSFLHELNEKLAALAENGSDEFSQRIELVLEWIRSKYGTV